VTVAGTATDARRALLGGLIDHAPLFPPASMNVPDAVAEDRRARQSPYAWMLARFVCPASRLEALANELPWPDSPALSVVLDGEGWADTTLVEEAARDGAPVEAVELRLRQAVPDARLLLEARERLRWTSYFELVLDEGWLDAVPKTIGSVAALGGRIKLRCGGERPEDVPSVQQVALVIAACREAGCVFKATAGLHHPIREGTTHGFLNLLAAASFAHAHRTASPDLERILAEEDPGAFSVSDGGVEVGGLSAGAAEIAAARRRLFAGYGSCSWREPVEDLQALEIL
jgi:hypothetical protein